MARGWIGGKSNDKKGKRKGEKNWVPPTEEEKDAAVNKRASHQTYLTAAGGAQVMYVNCYCTAYDSDHSRGEY